MKILLVPGLLLTSSLLWAQNPLQQYLTVPESRTAEYWHQSPEFSFPFEVSESVLNYGLDLNRLTNDHPVNALDFVAGTYQGFEFHPKAFSYAYNFPIHPRWGILTHPFVSAVDSGKPWIKHFNLELKKNEGVKSLAFQKELNELTGTRAYANNQLRHLKSPHSFAEILNQLNSTQDHAFISNYLFHCDKGSGPLLQLIEKKTKQGVRVFVIYDKYYSKADPTCADKLRSRGAQVLLHKGRKLLHVFHEKMFVFDGKYAQIDGQNIIAAQTLSNGTNNLLNDVAIGVQGPLAIEVANRFIHHWEDVLGGKLPDDLKIFYQNRNEEIQKDATDEALTNSLSKKNGQGICRLVAKDPSKNLSGIMKMYLHTVKNTKNYFFFNLLDAQYKNTVKGNIGEIFLKAVTEHANANPDMRVDLLTNNWRTATDFGLPLEYMPYRNLYTRLTLTAINLLMKRPHTQMHKIHANIKGMIKGENFHWWSYGMYMHAKTMMSDNIWTIVGTHNLNETSEDSSYESAVACLDQSLAEQMQRSIVVDALNSIPVPLNK